MPEDFNLDSGVPTDAALEALREDQRAGVAELRAQQERVRAAIARRTKSEKGEQGDDR